MQIVNIAELVGRAIQIGNMSPAAAERRGEALSKDLQDKDAYIALRVSHLEHTLRQKLLKDYEPEEIDFQVPLQAYRQAGQEWEDGIILQ